MPVLAQAATQIYQDAVRHSVRRASPRYLAQAALMVITGLLAILFPVISSETRVMAWKHSRHG
jgi:uncharacterized membrane protein HdeD (DUF308 family)